MGTIGLLFLHFTVLFLFSVCSLVYYRGIVSSVVGMNGMRRIIGLTMVSSIRCDSEECKQNTNSLWERSYTSDSS